MDGMTFGQRLRQARKAKGWTMEELAAVSGITRKTIYSCEHDTHGSSFFTATCLADALGVSLDWLACRTDKKE